MDRIALPEFYLFLEYGNGDGLEEATIVQRPASAVAASKRSGINLLSVTKVFLHRDGLLTEWTEDFARDLFKECDVEDVEIYRAFFEANGLEDEVQEMIDEADEAERDNAAHIRAESLTSIFL